MGKINIWLVDDAKDWKKNVQFLFKRSTNPSKDAIKLVAFGIDIVENADHNFMGEELLKYFSTIPKGDWPDVLYIDHNMPNMNGTELFKKILEHEIDIPVIIMTAYQDVIHEKIIHALELGAKGYIYKQNEETSKEDLLIDEIILTAERAYHDLQKDRMLLAINQTMNDERFLEADSIEKPAQALVDAVNKTMPNAICTVRKYNKQLKTLDLIHYNAEDMYRATYSLTQAMSPIFFELLSSEEGIIVKNDFKLKEVAGTDDVEESFQNMYINKMISVRIGPSSNIKGIFTIYRNSKAPQFKSDFIKDFFLTLAKSMYHRWRIMSDKLLVHDILDFIHHTIEADDKDEICESLVNFVHDNFNHDHNLSKTSLKLIRPGKDVLECHGEHCFRGERQTDYKPRLHEDSISAWVCRTGVPVRFDEIDEFDPQPFLDKFEETYGLKPQGNNAQIIYMPNTFTKMHSECCVPMENNQRIGGVLNLESPLPKRFSREDEKLLDMLSNIVAVRLENIQNKKFAEKLLKIIEMENYVEQVDETIKLISEYTGHAILILVKIDELKKNMFHVEKIDIPSLNNSVEELTKIKEEIQKATNERKSAISAFIDDDKDYEPIKDKSDVDTFYQSSLVQTHSQYIFALRIGKKLLGAISLEYEILDALDEKQIQMLKTVAVWLGFTHIKGQDAERLHYLVHDDMTTKLVRTFQHVYRNQESYLLESVEKLLKKVEKEENIASLQKIKEGIKKIGNIPERHFNKIKTDAEFLDKLLQAFVDSEKEIFMEERVEIDITMKNIDVNIYLSESSRNLIYFIFFHLIQNTRDQLKYKNKLKGHINIMTEITSTSLLKITFEDDAGGIQTSPIDNIFQADYTTKSEKGGYGLFYIRQELSKRLGGNISAENIAKGARFIIAIPTRKEEKIYAI